MKLYIRGHLHVDFNEEACAEAQKYYGYFVLVGNCACETFEALTAYRLREKIVSFSIL